MILYDNILRPVRLRSGQLRDSADPLLFDADYTDASPTVLAGYEVPHHAFKDQILASEKRIAHLVASSNIPAYRKALYGRSLDLESGAEIPTVSNLGYEFIGNFGSVIDATEERPLTEMPKQVIFRRNNNTNSFYKLGVFHFCFEDGFIYHTTDEVFLTGCVWDYNTQEQKFDNGESSPLPQSVESFWIADVLANLAQENWFVQESGLYAMMAAKCEQDLLAGREPSAKLLEKTFNRDPIKD